MIDHSEGMTMPQTQYPSAYNEQIQEIDQELKTQNRRWPTFAAAFLLLGGIALLVLLGKTFDFPDGRTLTCLGVFLLAVFALWGIRDHKKSKCFAVSFYGVLLPDVLKKAYAAYTPRMGDLDPVLFDPEEDWCLPTTVTFLVLSMGGFSFRAQGIYRIQRRGRGRFRRVRENL